MPLTLAHPAAAIPLRHPLGRAAVLAALVVGSITPDLPLFLPLGLSRNTTHTALALLWFCMPAGVLGYLLYDLVLDRPLRALGPEGLQRRLVRVGRAARPAVWSPAVLLSLLLGATTHSSWDAFTHGGAAGLGTWLPWLETRLFSVSGYTVYVFSVLQHTSSVLGTTVLAVWFWRWYRRAPQGETQAGSLAPEARRVVFLMLAIVVIVAATVALALRPPAEATIGHLQPVVRRVFVTSVSALVGAITLYAVWWHARQLRT